MYVYVLIIQSSSRVPCHQVRGSRMCSPDLPTRTVDLGQPAGPLKGVIGLLHPFHDLFGS